MGDINFPKTDNATVATPVADNKKLFMDTDENFYTKNSSGVVEAFGGGGSVEELIYYDMLPAPLKSLNYPYDSNGIRKRYTAYMNAHNSNDYFSKVKFRYKNFTTGVVTEDLTFADWTELETWVNNNVGNDGSLFTEYGAFDIYEKTDTNVPKLKAHLPVNSVFASICGNKYRSHAGTAIDGDYFNNLYTKAFNDLFGLNLSFNTSNNRRAVWLPLTFNGYNKGLVNITAWKSIISYPKFSANNRYYYDTGSGTFNALSIASTYIVTDVRMYTIDNLGVIQNSYTNSFTDRANFAKDIINDKLRYITVYGLQDMSDNTRKAIFIKPLGIDTISTNYVDYTKYDLEIVGVGKTDNHIVMKTITTAPDGNDIGSGRQKLLIEDWLPKGSKVTKASPLYTKQPKFYFRLRDKSTKKAGSLSSFYVYNFGIKQYGGRNTYGFLLGNDKS